MTGWLFLGGLAAYLVAMWLLLEWLTARDHTVMVRNVQEILQRSRTPDGSAPTPDRCLPPAPSGDRVGVERIYSQAICAPPTPSTPVDAVVYAPRHAAPAGLHRRVTVHG